MTKKNKDENFYDQKVKEIEETMKTDNVKAIEMLKEELSMPYIPEKYEIVFQNLMEKVFLVSLENVKENGKFSDDKVIEYLWSNNPINESIAVDALTTMNLRPHAEELKKWVETKGDESNIGKAFIIESLIDQKVDVTIKHKGREINASTTKSVLDDDTVRNIFKLTEDKISKEPQLTDVVFSEIKRYLLTTYPEIPVDAELFSTAIINVVKSMLNNELSLNDFEAEIKTQLMS